MQCQVLPTTEEGDCIVKRMTIVILLAVLMIAPVLIAEKGLAAGEVQGSSSVGRFQLFQGTFTIVDSKNSRSEKQVEMFLLDTSTGRVQRYAIGVDKDGKLFEGWLDVGGTVKSK